MDTYSAVRSAPKTLSCHVCYKKICTSYPLQISCSTCGKTTCNICLGLQINTRHTCLRCLQREKQSKSALQRLVREFQLDPSAW